MNLDRPEHVPADQLEWYLSRHSLTLGSSEGSKTLVIEPRAEALDVLRTILGITGTNEKQLQELRAAAKKVLAEEPHERGWHVGTEATAYGTLSHVYTPDHMAGRYAHRQIATNMSDTNADYFARLHPVKLLPILDQLDRLEDTASQAVADYEAAQLQLHNIDRLHQPVTMVIGVTTARSGEPAPAGAATEERCSTCHTAFPCDTRKALTGAQNV